ncbi:hypothetical protein DAPPUDRAFT_98627 [Daphnia pulex]|uniref:Uncharacterized protein n=1 Tax=Daphnia pulex TaxID=6669 RepID=E9G5B8_DAPPU|nr:hypothetical protein DAPPUDRAFT_98627 [Daphnia pulex]|eukprot:EFX85658.1 hypothetical protein DAPPUDRAFT_98627 [Daphnia pulex]
MSSRRAVVGVAVVPLKPNSTSSSLPVLMSRAVPSRSSIKLNAMRPPTALAVQQTGERNEVSSRVVATSKTSALVSSVSVTKDLTLSKMSSKTVTSTTTSKPPLWQSMKSSLGSRLDRVSPSNKQVKEKSNKEEQMATSTGTESSGVFSSSENGSIKDLNKESTTPTPVNNRRPTTQSSTSRLTAAMAKTTSRLVSKRPATTTTTTTGSADARLRRLNPISITTTSSSIAFSTLPFGKFTWRSGVLT